ncbi:MAG: hypothetical protein J5994_11415 [Ruminococcus sp.]|nr:hypothetical protein [Ruminococcus sp.]
MNTERKTKLHYRILTLLLAIVMCITCIPDLTVFAGYNGGGVGGGAGTSGKGINPSNCGIRVYLYDVAAGKIATVEGKKCIQDILSNEFKANINVDSAVKSGYTYRTRLGNNKSEVPYMWESDLPEDINFGGSLKNYVIKTTCFYPFAFEVYGTEFANYMTEKININGKEIERVAYFVLKLFDKDAFKDIMNNGYKIIVEPIIASELYSTYNGGATGTFLYAPIEAFHKYYYDKYPSAPAGGYIGGPLAALARGFRLTEADEKCELDKGDNGFEFNKDINGNGVAEYDTWKDYGNKGYGIHIYTVVPVKRGNPISTYDWETQPTNPAISEEPTKAKKNTAEDAGLKDGEGVEIVKLYGYAYKRSDYTGTNKRYVAVEQIGKRLGLNGKNILGTFH